MNISSSKKIQLLFLLLSAITVVSCSKDEENNTPAPVGPKLSIELDHMAGNKNFFLDSIYVTANGDTIIASMFKYYVSNIRLITSGNAEVAIPESYFLVNQDKPESLTLQMNDLPAGTYTGIKFMLGVDSTRNVSGAQTGALDAGNAMFWDWNTGYIFLKIEGTSPSIPGTSQFFEYHIGGFEGANINYKEIQLDFDGDQLTLANNTNPELHLVVNVLEIFANPATIDMATFPPSVTMPNANAAVIANNYADMFRYDHIHD